MVIVALVNGQAPLLVINHCKTFIPNPKLVTIVVGELGLVIFPLPLINDHVPTPDVGVLPANKVELLVTQSV